ncbi:VWA domain-containing protein [Lysinibacillus sp. LZ02]|uniref:VWA domain-containing protein n=1 Tax=Lysinibacillus sp. LZ02 TaxID=3420668 RepID=UPI003D35C5DE
MDLRIDIPFALLLFIPVVLYFGFVLKRHKAEWKKLHYIVYVLRIATVSCLIFALANPYILLPIDKEQVLFLMDRSASASAEEDTATQFIQEALTSKEDKHEVGIYSFASAVQTESLLSDEVEAVPQLSAMSAVSDTNIEEALKMVTSIADQQKATRIVLLTDGNETEGEALLEVNKLKNSNVSIDVVPLAKSVNEDIILESFETPQIAYEGEQQQLVTNIYAENEKQAELILYENDEKIVQQSVTLQAGHNRFTFNHMSSATGLVKYEALVQTANDAFLENNKLTSVTTVQAAPRLLIVQDDEATSKIPAIIGNSTIDYAVTSASTLPSSLSSYLAYNAIIFDNVSAHTVGEAKMEVIEQAVKHFGVGFMMVGGDQAFGLGGYFKTPIEALLPVEMDVQGKHEMPSLGLVLVIDRSGSMMGNKLELAKEAAARSIELLRDDDTLGVIAFDDRPWPIIETAKLADKEEATDAVLSIPAGGGTEIYSSLALAYEGLQDLKLQRKHIILLTDGYSSTNMSYDDLIAAGLEKNVTLSTVAIGQDADRNLLESLSDMGSGRFYDVVDETTIPSILSRETSMMTRTYIEDNPFYPTVYKADKWNHLFADGVAQMNAYIGTTAKPLATVVAESEKEDPVLATWQYGLGTTIAFTSDAAGAWAGGWATWVKWREFWQTAIAELLPSYHDVAYSVSSDGNGQFTITDVSNEAAFLSVTAINEAGEELPIETDVLSASKMKVFADGEPGLVFFSIVNKDGEMVKVGVQMPYSDEYKQSTTNTALLETIANSSGGQVIEKASDVFRPFQQKGTESRSITTWLLVIALLLFFMDITLRRFGFSFKKKQVVAPNIIEETPTNVSELLKQLKRK